jgi:hypothetical protein
LAGTAAVERAFVNNKAGRRKQTCSLREREKERGANPTFIGFEWS